MTPVLCLRSHLLLRAQHSFQSRARHPAARMSGEHEWDEFGTQVGPSGARPSPAKPKRMKRASAASAASASAPEVLVCHLCETDLSKNVTKSFKGFYFCDGDCFNAVRSYRRTSGRSADRFATMRVVRISCFKTFGGSMQGTRHFVRCLAFGGAVFFGGWRGGVWGGCPTNRFFKKTRVGAGAVDQEWGVGRLPQKWGVRCSPL